jgi:beta-ureidopropionase / N-carbamoyl-L-amino-acid hydrolase
MLFVRNPTGVSHSPAEHIEAGDAETGAAALTTVLERLRTT